MKKSEQQEMKFVLRAAGGPSETAAPGLGAVSDEVVIHHVLKFNPMDSHTIEQFSSEWLFQKEPVMKDPYEEKKKMKNKTKAPEEQPQASQDWKRPWLIADSGDAEFTKAFLAKRETDKRSKRDVLVSITLTKVEVYCKPDVRTALRDQVKTVTNPELLEIYEKAKTCCMGPGTDVISKQEVVKGRLIDESKKFEVTELFVRMSQEHLKKMEEYKKQEEEKIVDLWKNFQLAEEMKPGKVGVDINGKILSWKIEEEGRKQHSYFWLEMVQGELVVRPVHGDWWAARKDATRRGHLTNDDETSEKPGAKKKEQEKDETSNIFRRLLDKTKEATADEYIEKGQLVKKKVKEARRALEETGEDRLKQQWREENHGEDDEMDAQQCGDIDDDDYDQKMAAAGDDLALAAEEIIKHIDGEEDAPEEALKSDSEDEGGEEAMDQEGKKIDRLLKGKSATEDDIPDIKDEDKSSPYKEKMEEEEKTLPPEVKTSALKITIPNKAKQDAKRPADSAPSGQNPAKKPKPGEPAPAAGPPAQVWTKCPPVPKVREYFAKAKDISSGKLIGYFNVKKYPPEEQKKFMQIVKDHCIRTKKVLEDGPFKGQPVLSLKPLPSAAGGQAGAAVKTEPKA